MISMDEQGELLASRRHIDYLRVCSSGCRA